MLLQRRFERKVLMSLETHTNNASLTSGRSSRRTALLGCALVLCALAIVPAVNGQATGGSKLYIVDSNDTKLSSSVLVVDPDQKTVIKTYAAGFHPDIALSKDGKRLFLAFDYLTSSQTQSGKLQVIDTTTDAVITTVESPNRWLAIGPTYDSVMALSSDDRWLYQYQMKEQADGSVFYGVAVFDTANNQFLPDVISLPLCEAAILVPARQSSNLSVVCSGTNDVRTISLNSNGLPATRLPRGVMIPRHSRLATAFVSGNDNMVTTVMGDGNFSQLDLGTRKTVGGGALAITSNSAGLNGGLIPAIGTPKAAALGGKFLRLQPPQQYGGKLYVGLVRSSDNLQMFDEISVLDSATFQQQASIVRTTTPFWSMALGNSGTRIYAVDPIGAAVHVLSASDGAEISKIDGLGKSPTLVIPAP